MPKRPGFALCLVVDANTVLLSPDLASTMTARTTLDSQEVFTHLGMAPWGETHTQPRPPRARWLLSPAHPRVDDAPLDMGFVLCFPIVGSWDRRGEVGDAPLESFMSSYTDLVFAGSSHRNRVKWSCGSNTGDHPRVSPLLAAGFILKPQRGGSSFACFTGGSAQGPLCPTGWRDVVHCAQLSTKS